MAHVTYHPLSSSRLAMETVTMPTNHIGVHPIHSSTTPLPIPILDLDTSPSSSPAYRPKANKMADTLPHDHRVTIATTDNHQVLLAQESFHFPTPAKRNEFSSSPISEETVSSSPNSLSELCQTDNDASSSGHLLATPDHARASPLRSFVHEDRMSPSVCPSSPLCSAVRDAVDSLSQYDDFDVLEQIGTGFFADVYKVRQNMTCYSFVVYIHMYIQSYT